MSDFIAGQIAGAVCVFLILAAIAAWGSRIK